jgi:hypothetical protein
MDLGHTSDSTKITSTTLEVPLDHSDRKARLSLSTDAQMVLVRKRTRKWHAALAGALAGAFAIVCESKYQRSAIAQQVFVRCVLSVSVSPRVVLKAEIVGSRDLITHLQPKGAGGYLMAMCWCSHWRELIRYMVEIACSSDVGAARSCMHS